MIYFICPANHNHINYAPGNPSNDWICGWDTCGTRLHYSPAFLFVYRNAPMRPALYAPGGTTIGQFHQEQYNYLASEYPNLGLQQQSMPQPFVPQPVVTQPFVPQPTFQTFQPPAIQPQVVQQQVAPQQTTRPRSSSVGMEMETATPVTIHTPQDFVEMTFGTPIVNESQSQGLLYQVLEENGYLFLCRDGQFRKCKLGNQILDPEETVQEPGVVSGGYNGYCPHQFHSTFIMGRNESNKRYYGKGQISYPDYVVKKSNIIYSIELKTPRNQSFKTYLSNHFYTENVFKSGRSIVDELEIRRGLTHHQVEICLLFDIRNINDENQAMTDLKNSITSHFKVKGQMTRKQWWERNVNGVIFYKNSGLTKRFTIADITAGQNITNPTQQGGIKNFFSTLQ